MIINNNQMLTITEANQNFSKAVEIAEKNGSAVISKDDRPRYMLIDLEQNPVMDLTDDEKIDVVSKRVLERHRSAFEELAK